MLTSPFNNAFLSYLSRFSNSQPATGKKQDQGLISTGCLYLPEKSFENPHRGACFQKTPIKPDDRLSLQEASSDTSSLQSSQVQSTVDFQKNASTPTVLLLQAASTTMPSRGGNHFMSPLHPSCSWLSRNNVSLSRARKTIVWIHFGFVFCLSAHTKIQCNNKITKKKPPSFAFLSEGHQEHLVIQPTVLCIHCHKIPTCSMNRQSKIQIKPKKTFKMQSLSQFCSKSYSTYHIYLVLQ